MATSKINNQITINYNLVPLNNSHYNNVNVDPNKNENHFQMEKLNDAFYFILVLKLKFIYNNMYILLIDILFIIF